jgi:hypothetical protein
VLVQPVKLRHPLRIDLEVEYSEVLFLVFGLVDLREWGYAVL